VACGKTKFEGAKCPILEEAPRRDREQEKGIEEECPSLDEVIW
jgi:hypothetical protein